MQHLLGSAEQPAHNSANNSAEQPASCIPDAEREKSRALLMKTIILEWCENARDELDRWAASSKRNYQFFRRMSSLQPRDSPYSDGESTIASLDSASIEELLEAQPFHIAHYYSQNSNASTFLLNIPWSRQHWEERPDQLWCTSIKRLYRKPLWKQLGACCAEQAATSLPQRQRRTTSAVSLPASEGMDAEVLFGIPRETVRLIIRFIGAHNIEAIWECSECNPYWYDWYCADCEMINKYLYWSPKKHFGYCGSYCGCCRSAEEHGDGPGCEACDELWNLKGACRTMRNLMTMYNGT